jgi:hypothetical protein
MKILNWIFKRPAETVVNIESSDIEELLLNSKDVNNTESNQEFSKSSILSSEDKNRYIEMIANGEAIDSSFDSLFEEAARLIVMHQQGSMSLIQRKLSLGYNRAGRIIDQLELARIIGPSNGSQARKILIDDEEKLERHLRSIGFPFSLDDFYEDNKSEIDRRRLELEKSKRIEADKFEKERIKSKLLEKERMKTLEKEAIKELIEEGKIKK